MKTLFWISLSINVALVSFFVYRRLTARSSAIDYNQWNESRNNVLSGLPIDTSSIVFIGTSLTEGFPLNELYPELPIKNRGIAGNKISHILSRITPMLQALPKKIFIEGGTNDLVDDEHIIMNDYRKLLYLVKESNVKAYVQALPPLCGVSLQYQPKADSVNSFLKKLCDSLRVGFINISQPLKKESGLDSALSYDCIHLNAKGYAIWKKEIDPYINE